MVRIDEHEIVQYRITPSGEAAPKDGDALHAHGLTNWHLVVVEVLQRFKPNKDGTQDVRLRVLRTEIGKERRPCPVCGATWMVNAGAET